MKILNSDLTKLSERIPPDPDLQLHFEVDANKVVGTGTSVSRYLRTIKYYKILMKCLRLKVVVSYIRNLNFSYDYIN